MVKQLDAGLKRLAAVFQKDLGAKVANLPGAGEAGGLGAGLVAMLYAQLFESIVTPASVRICRISVSLVATNRRSSA